MFDEEAFDRAVTAARSIHVETGFLPALDDPRVESEEFALWSDFDGDDTLDELIAVQSGDQPETRAAVGAGFYMMLRSNPVGSGFDRLLSAIHRYLDSAPTLGIVDDRILRWELHAAGTVAASDRVLALGHRADSFELRHHRICWAGVGVTGHLLKK